MAGVRQFNFIWTKGRPCFKRSAQEYNAAMAREERADELRSLGKLGIAAARQGQGAFHGRMKQTDSSVLETVRRKVIGSDISADQRSYALVALDLTESARGSKRRLDLEEDMRIHCQRVRQDGDIQKVDEHVEH